MQAVKTLNEHSEKWDLEILAEIGLQHNYPPCCIYAFCQDMAKDKYPFQERGIDTDDKRVPCLNCKKP